MVAGNDLESDPSPFEGTPFEEVDHAVYNRSDYAVDRMVSEAGDIYKAAKDRGVISVEDYVIRNEAFYADGVGPVAATADELTWSAAYTLDLSEAIEPGTPEMREVEETFELPNRRVSKYLASFLRRGYRVLYDYTEETGLPMHPEKLKLDTPVILEDEYYDEAFYWLDRYPGVRAPSDSFEWQWKDAEEGETAEASEQSEA